MSNSFEPPNAPSQRPEWPSPPHVTPRTSKLAVAALVTGLLAMCAFPLVLVAIPCGIIGLVAINNAKGALKGKGMAISGLVMSGVAIVLIPVMAIIAAIAFPALMRAREAAERASHQNNREEAANWGQPETGEAAQRASCQNNLKQMGLVFKMFSGEHKNNWPNLSPVVGNLMCDESVYPEYLADPSVLLCPAHSEPSSPPLDPKQYITDGDYFYFGYCLTNDAEVEAFADAYRQASNDPTAFSEDLKVQPGKGSNGGDTLYHVREGVERFFITDINNTNGAAKAQSIIPVLVERPTNHVPQGGNVLFMDGHVEFIKYPGKFPMTVTTITALESLSSSKAQ